MAYVIASSDANGKLFTASILDVANAAWNVFVKRLDMSSALSSFVNRAVTVAEEKQPEGSQIELIIAGWTNPITGTDYSSKVASWINDQWINKNVTGAGGEPILPWDEYPGRIAWSRKDAVILRWKKGAVQVVVILGLAAACLVALAILASVVGNWFSSWNMVNTGKGKQSTWWDKLSVLEKTAVIAGGFVAGLFCVWFLASKSIAEAGAPQIIVER